MTQEQLAEKVFVTRQAVSAWETGKALPDVETLERIAGALERFFRDDAPWVTAQALGKGGMVRAAQAPRELATPLPDVELTMDGNGVIDFPQVDARVVLAGVNDGDGRVTVAHDGPWPFEVTLMETDIDVEARSEE